MDMSPSVQHVAPSQSFPRPRVLVVEHEKDAGPGMLGEALRAEGAELIVVGPEAGAPIPSSLDGYDGLIVLGGTPGPLEDDIAPWLPAVRALVASALETELPQLGVCLGSQILAVVAGGRVSEAALPEVGLGAFALTPAAAGDPLLGGLEASDGGPLRAMQWHLLEVTELPAGSSALASSERCANQAFRVGPAAWGLQFHLEADAATARRWVNDPGAAHQLAQFGVSTTSITEPMAAAEAILRDTWSAVAKRWLAMVREQQAQRA